MEAIIALKLLYQREAIKIPMKISWDFMMLYYQRLMTKVLNISHHQRNFLRILEREVLIILSFTWQLFQFHSRQAAFPFSPCAPFCRLVVTINLPLQSSFLRASPATEILKIAQAPLQQNIISLIVHHRHSKQASAYCTLYILCACIKAAGTRSMRVW